jgi:hypothetical protein
LGGVALKLKIVCDINACRSSWINKIICDVMLLLLLVTVACFLCVSFSFWLMFCFPFLFICSYLLPKALKSQEYAALDLQRYIRGHLARNLMLGILFPSIYCFIVYLIELVIKWFNCVFKFTYILYTFILSNNVGSASKLRAVAAGCISKPTSCCSFQLELLLFQVVKLQRWWKHLMLHKLRTKSAIIIQSHIRAWVARRKAIAYRHHIIVIQVMYFNSYHLIIMYPTVVLMFDYWFLIQLFWFISYLTDITSLKHTFPFPLR